MSEAPEARFNATTVYGALSDQPLVEVDCPAAFPFKVTPNEARGMAYVLLEAAEASEMDAIVYRWMKGRMGATVEQSARVMADFRTIRDTLRGEHP